MGWVGGILMMLLLLIFTALIIGLIGLVIWAIVRRASGLSGGASGGRGDDDRRALRLLKERYARGEISREQYDEIRRDLDA
jgi:putative membrane protein